jgi:hypothetical protein
MAGTAYTLGVFAFAFAVGAIRVTMVAPLLGAIPAVIIEAPIVLAVSWRVSRWCIRRFAANCTPRVRVWMGFVAFWSLMWLELGVAVLVFGETVDHYFARLASLPGAIGLGTQVGFAFIPWIQGRLRC